jgi:hypothetical protein
MTGPEWRPAVSFWQRAESERQAVRQVQESAWRRRMLSAGNIDPADLSNQALRILAWLAEWDDWTVDGVAELLTAAHRAGQTVATPVGEPTARHASDDSTPADATAARLAALCEQRPTGRGVGR